MQAMIVLMLGSMKMLPIFALRSQLPGKVAIFRDAPGPSDCRVLNCKHFVRFSILLVLLSIAS
ncbi:hypothetical protein RG963_06710 [Methanosarcina sp. Z-7115]|uniref:Uncharacterized protein n=1 Tax=Methanosarcina baikalica TaxID=3073890 RepID=A0ABU2D0I3_9EURY|nr:hypothetical protein [Methanosarcina sp. Z-7115]MDR7665474.1 hypothetical protein [Methanosarcina sp. Z-7115]